MKSAPAAALAGELAGASRLSAAQLEAAQRAFDAALAATAGWSPAFMPSGAAGSAAEGWRLVLHEAAPALRVAVYLRARLRAACDTDLRLAIAVGELAAGGAADGAAVPVLDRAAHQLRRLPRHLRLTAVLDGAGTTAPARWLLASTALLDAVARRWTRRQAEILALAMVPEEPRFEDVAVQLGITKQAVSKALGSAGWAAVRTALHTFEGEDWAAALRSVRH